VKPGTYREYLQILDEDRITLKGEHATLRPAATPAPTLCNSMGDLTDVCVVGRLRMPLPTGNTPPTILRRTSSDRITGFTISGFGANGIFAFASNRLRIDHNTLSANGDYGGFSNTSARLDHNVAKGNRGEAGLYVGDSARAKAVVTRNRMIDNHGEGLLVRSASHGRVSRNVSSGNCIGIVVLADAPGPAGHWTISRNLIRRNNTACKANPEEGSPALSGIGLALAGADHTKVTRNTITGNRKLHTTAFAGGVVIRRGGFAKNGTKPTGVAIALNVVLRNEPFDIDCRQGGDLSFSRDVCRTSRPAGICR
jgi:nitrous oxidase accessory protein NosD